MPVYMFISIDSSGLSFLDYFYVSFFKFESDNADVHAYVFISIYSIPFEKPREEVKLVSEAVHILVLLF